MPYHIEKIVNTKRYKVINENTGEVKAKYSTRTNAQKQIRLLKSLEKSPIKWVR
jgi:hypothetical protein